MTDQVSNRSASLFLARKLQQHLAGVQHDHAVSVFHGMGHVVRDHHRGQLQRVHSPERCVQHQIGGARIKRRRMLIEKQDVGFATDGHDQ